MNYELYLLWIPNEGWGIFNTSSCPDTDIFPKWLYRKYIIPSEKYNQAFNRLLKTKEKLDSKKIVPKKENENEIFPRLENLI